MSRFSYQKSSQKPHGWSHLPTASSSHALQMQNKRDEVFLWQHWCPWESFKMCLILLLPIHLYYMKLLTQQRNLPLFFKLLQSKVKQNKFFTVRMELLAQRLASLQILQDKALAINNISWLGN